MEGISEIALSAAGEVRLKVRSDLAAQSGLSHELCTFHNGERCHGNMQRSDSRATRRSAKVELWHSSPIVGQGA